MRGTHMFTNHNIAETDPDEELENADVIELEQHVRNQRRINPDLETGTRKQT